MLTINECKDVAQKLLSVFEHWLQYGKPVLSDDDLQTIHKCLLRIGFLVLEERCCIERTSPKIDVSVCDQDGSYLYSEKETVFFPYVIFDYRGRPDYHLHNWLEKVIKEIIKAPKSWGMYDQGRAEEELAGIIFSSQPMEPIELNPDGEELIDRPKSDNPFAPRQRDSDSLKNVFQEGIGNHNWCGGALWLYTVSKDSFVIHCERCGLRVPIPISATLTYGTLRVYLSKT